MKPCIHCGAPLDNQVTICPKCGGDQTPAPVALPESGPGGDDREVWSHVAGGAVLGALCGWLAYGGLGSAIGAVVGAALGLLSLLGDPG